MNRRTKIIVSVAGIFIVLLALLGITYAYFLTKINGNSNAKSISVTTANLELTYLDGNGAIAGNNIMPGTTLTTKEFSVRNDGEDTEYLVVLEDVTIKDSSNNDTTFESNDFTYTLTCTSGCNSVTDEVLPLSNGILVSNSIKKGTTQIYKLTITYNETGIDQSNDMGKALSARVNISTIERFNPYANKKNSLAYNIINNAILNKNGTEFRLSPLTIPAKEISLENEKELSIAADDYGTSYYYRGAVEDNYIEFNNMCWRIVRIEGDGSIKITLTKEDKCNTLTESDVTSATINNNEYVIFGYTVSGDSTKYNYQNYNGGLYTSLLNWYNLKIKNAQKYLKNETWCLGGEIYDKVTKEIINDKNGYSISANRIDVIKNASYKCDKNEDIFNDYIGTLSVDEVAFAGLIRITNESTIYTSYILKEAKTSIWTLSISYHDSEDTVFTYINNSGGITEEYIKYYQPSGAVRPAITLKPGTQISSGDGTIENPYIIE